jgi:8-oxo-dGTP pyrophosphatase MutT (NUDIX family)
MVPPWYRVVVWGTPMRDQGNASITPVARCRLQVWDLPWPFAEQNGSAIDAHWRVRTQTNPSFFNGVVLLMREGAVRDGTFEAQFSRTDFKSFLYWREQGFPPADACDAFGSALLYSREGHVLLGRQRSGHINAGLIYPPSGFIDARDAAADGTIDIAGSIRRELAEETGLAGADVTASSGFLIVRTGPQVAITAEFRSALAADALRALMLDRIAADPDPELADIVIARRAGDLDPSLVLPYAQMLLTHVLPA